MLKEDLSVFFLVFQRFAEELFEASFQQTLIRITLLVRIQKGISYIFSLLLLLGKRKKQFDNKEHTNKTFEATKHAFFIANGIPKNFPKKLQF